MTRTTLIAVLALSAAALADPPAESYDRDYALLTQQNMFLRDRPAPRKNTDRPRPRIRYDTPEMLEQVVVLRGVVIEDAELHAYAENTHTGVVIRLSPGDPIARGRISDIAIDAIAYEADGKTVWVDVGENLAGGQSAETPSTQPTTAPSVQSRPGTPPSLPPGGGTLEERLKARRQQQIQKK